MFPRPKPRYWDLGSLSVQIGDPGKWVLILQPYSSSLHQQTGQNSLSGKVRPSVENHELVLLIQIPLHARHIPRCLNVIADSLSRSTQIQSTRVVTTPSSVQKNLPKVVHSSTCQNHKLPLYVSPVPDQQTWNINTLNIN